MRFRLRKFVLTLHVSSSVGWFGAVLVYLALATASLTSVDVQSAQAGYLVLHHVAYTVVVPLSLTALLSGLVQSLGTEWGLFRHYWILAKFLLTAIAVAVLFAHADCEPRVAHRRTDHLVPVTLGRYDSSSWFMP